MTLDSLPHLDEHSVLIAAPPEVVWDAALAVLQRAFGAGRAPRIARLLGCEPLVGSRWDDLAAGATLPGFAVVQCDRPRLLAIAGRHRFSRYGIVLRIDPASTGAVCRLESRAEFPGRHGRLYRAAVVGTGGHVVVVRRLLAAVRRRAESTGSPARPSC